MATKADISNLKEFVTSVFEPLAKSADTALLKTETSNLKEQISATKTDLQQDLSEIKTDLQQALGGLKTDLQQDLTAVQLDLRKDLGEIKTTLAKLQDRLPLGARTAGGSGRH